MFLDLQTNMIIKVKTAFATTLMTEKNQINRIFRAIVQLVCKYASIFEGIFA